LGGVPSDGRVPVAEANARVTDGMRRVAADGEGREGGILEGMSEGK
jgi:hypothetical protein